MIYKIYPTQDTTIYEKTPTQNTGLDAILEIGKTVVSSSATTLIYNSRALLKFDYTDLNPLVAAGFVSHSATDTNKYFLKLYAVKQKELPSTYTIEVDTVSGSWTMGLGRYDYRPIQEEGVSWKYINGKTAGTQWLTASYSPSSTGSYIVTPGGATWYTASSLIATKSYAVNEAVDPEINITTLVYGHLTGSIANNGFVVRRENSEEKIADNVALEYFSIDTNTIYLPHLIVKWDDAVFNTGSLLPIGAGQDPVVYFQNLNQKYTTEDRARIRVVARPKYPTRSFSTSSVYSTVYYLPASSSYAVEDLHTAEVVIPYDDVYTRVSCDATSSFFNFWMGVLQPERWYKFTIRSVYDNNYVKIHDSDYIFKIERANNA